jgi:6-phosphogluconate dehydrogenase
MNIGIIGLGKMGSAVAARLLAADYSVIAFDASEEIRKTAHEAGLQLADSAAEVSQHARIVWLFVPAGDVVDNIITQLLINAQENHIIIDGGNSFFQDSIKRAKNLEQQGVFFLDCGTSGGLHGRDLGFCLMIGGAQQAYDRAEPIFNAIAMNNGYTHVGPSGAGHYVKMIHNGIEYGLLEAYAEGFSLLHNQNRYNFDSKKIANLWTHGSIIRSWLLELTAQVFKEQGQDLSTIGGEIQEGGTGRWTLDEAELQKVPMPILEKSLEVRAWSRKTGGDYATALIALIRHQFGGHNYKIKKQS